ncbi:hypothetical protein [Treponema parvum]|nr:hypothetical protein [Treponema parvum]
MGGTASALSMGYAIALLIIAYLTLTAVSVLIRFLKKKFGKKK